MTKRKVKQPNVYFRALIKHNLPIAEKYELNEDDEGFIKHFNEHPKKIQGTLGYLTKDLFVRIIIALEMKASSEIENQWKINFTQAKLECQKKGLMQT